MKNQTLQFHVHSLRTLSSPYSRLKGDVEQYETLYYLLVNMKDIPSGIPLDVNPREPKMSTNVAKNLKRAVVEPETDFYINNRGIVISAKSLVFDTLRSMVSIDIGDQDDENDRSQYGILDGGHTYTAIISERDKIPENFEKYVRIEVITNVQNITRLSDARNTSVQVSDIALFNLDEKFDSIKLAVQNQPYADRVAYKDNEDKDINVAEFLRLIYALDIDKYPNDSAAPVQSYSGKAQVFKNFKTAYDSPLYKSLIKQLPTLVNLYDTIELELAEKYREYKEQMGIKPKFGNVRGVEVVGKDSNTDSTVSTFYLRRPIQYKVSSGYIYPIFGAFRSLLHFSDVSGEAEWMFDPVEIWEDVGTSLVQNTFESSNNPQFAGKDKQLWLSNYRIVETQSLRKLLKRAQ